MSEHQVYEFVAIDTTLTAAQMAELRAISTRAEITPTGVRNEYDWGDLKADPKVLVERIRAEPRALERERERAARAKHLDALARRELAAWKELEQLVATSAYDSAVRLALDLRDLARRADRGGDFEARFAALRSRQARRRGFFDRYRRASALAP